MDVNKEIGSAAIFAQVAWIAAGLFLYLTTPGAELLSGSAAVFFVAGMFAAALIFGTGFYGLQRALEKTVAVPAGGPADARTRSLFAWGLPIAEAAIIFVAAFWAFQSLESFRAGVPVEYALERDNFDASLKAFSAANTLEEEAKAGRESGQVDADIETRVVALMENGIARSRNVGGPFLAYLDPELPQKYQLQLIKGYELLVQGRRTGDVAMQTEGNDLVRAFYEEFLPAKADAILEKLGLQAE